jgi:hypothetical protein
MTWSGHLMKKLEDAVTLAWNGSNEVSKPRMEKKKGLGLYYYAV